MRFSMLSRTVLRKSARSSDLTATDAHKTSPRKFIAKKFALSSSVASSSPFESTFYVANTKTCRVFSLFFPLVCRLSVVSFTFMAP